MKPIHLPDTMLYHIAGSDFGTDPIQAIKMGCKYRLFSAYMPVARLQSAKKKAPISKIILDKIKYETETFDHVIQDSGLFTMLFGCKAGQVDKQTIYSWYGHLVDFILQHGQPITCVEVDAQAIIGPEETFKLRERMRNDLPNNRIINVFHLQDGKKGLDRLIEFSDYIALSSRFISNFPGQVRQMIEYIKNKKPDIDIHLLGFSATELCPVVKKICSSCDSTAWLTPRRFGRVGGFACANINMEAINKEYGDQIKGLAFSSDPKINASMVANLHYLNSNGLRCLY